MNTVTIKLVNGKPMFRGKEVVLPENQERLLKGNGKKISIKYEQLKYKTKKL